MSLLAALSCPAVVLDANFRVLLVNAASTADYLFARSCVGETDLGRHRREPRALALAQQRHRYYAHSLRTQEPLFFEEETLGDQGFLWICLPFRDTQQAGLVVIGLDAEDAGCQHAACPRLRQRLHQELCAPLTALVTLASTLAHGLSEAQQAQALLIEESGERLLHALHHLTGSPPSPAAY